MEGGQVLFPPNIFLIFWSHCTDHVIEVHDNVDESVEKGEECAVAAWK